MHGLSTTRKSETLLCVHTYTMFPPSHTHVVHIRARNIKALSLKGLAPHMYTDAISERTFASCRTRGSVATCAFCLRLSTMRKQPTPEQRCPLIEPCVRVVEACPQRAQTVHHGNHPAPTPSSGQGDFTRRVAHDDALVFHLNLHLKERAQNGTLTDLICRNRVFRSTLWTRRPRVRHVADQNFQPQAGHSPVRA